jgi:hypothetical protein
MNEELRETCSSTGEEGGGRYEVEEIDNGCLEREIVVDEKEAKERISRVNKRRQKERRGGGGCKKKAVEEERALEKKSVSLEGLSSSLEERNRQKHVELFMRRLNGTRLPKPSVENGNGC